MRTIDQGVFERIQLVAKVRELLEVGSQRRLLEIEESVYRELVWEFQVTLHIKVHGDIYQMSALESHCVLDYMISNALVRRSMRV